MERDNSQKHPKRSLQIQKSIHPNHGKTTSSTAISATSVTRKRRKSKCTKKTSYFSFVTNQVCYIWIKIQKHEPKNIIKSQKKYPVKAYPKLQVQALTTLSTVGARKIRQDF